MAAVTVGAAGWLGDGGRRLHLWARRALASCRDSNRDSHGPGHHVPRVGPSRHQGHSSERNRRMSCMDGTETDEHLKYSEGAHPEDENRPLAPVFTEAPVTGAQPRGPWPGDGKSTLWSMRTTAEDSATKRKELLARPRGDPRGCCAERLEPVANGHIPWDSAHVSTWRSRVHRQSLVVARGCGRRDGVGVE